jgi:hypothetical protein
VDRITCTVHPNAEKRSRTGTLRGFSPGATPLDKRGDDVLEEGFSRLLTAPCVLRRLPQLVLSAACMLRWVLQIALTTRCLPRESTGAPGAGKPLLSYHCCECSGCVVNDQWWSYVRWSHIRCIHGQELTVEGTTNTATPPSLNSGFAQLRLKRQLFRLAAITGVGYFLDERYLMGAQFGTMYAVVRSWVLMSTAVGHHASSFCIKDSRKNNMKPVRYCNGVLHRVWEA